MKPMPRIGETAPVLADLPSEPREKAEELIERILGPVQTAWQALPHHPVTGDQNAAMRRAMTSLAVDVRAVVEELARYLPVATMPDSNCVVDLETGTVLGTNLMLLPADAPVDPDEISSDAESAHVAAMNFGWVLCARDPM